MKTGQGFLLVFSITSMTSLYELAELREQIRRIKEDDNVPMVLVGNKSDLEDDRSVPRPRAFKISQDWGNIPYYETSARRRANVDEVFVDLCRQIMIKDQRAYPQTRDRRHGAGRDPRNPRQRDHDRGRRQRHRRPVCTIL
jgi:GTPase SAR1 family protein